jgi:hypothetical protein
MFLAAGGLLVLIGVIFALQIYRVVRRPEMDDFDPAWIEDFSIARYRPMLRLLDDADFEFLASQAGYEAAIARRLRAERRRIFKAYLSNLTRDFNRLYFAGKLFLVNAPVDRPDLAAALLKQRVTFIQSIVAIHVGLAFATLGIGRVDVRKALSCLESLRADVATLVPSTSAI